MLRSAEVRPPPGQLPWDALVLLLVEEGEGVELASHAQVLSATRILSDLQCLLKQLLGIPQLPPLHVDACQLVQRASHARVVWI